MGRLRFIPPSKEEAKDSVAGAGRVDVNDADAKAKGKKVAFSKEDRQRVTLKEEDPMFSFNFPNLLRYFLIAALVIMIGLIVGGQAVSIRKGTQGS